MGTGISKEDRGVLAQIKLSFVKAMNKYSKKIDRMTKAQLNREIQNLPSDTKTEYNIFKQSRDNKKKILKLLYKIQQAESIKAAPKLLKGDTSRYEYELSKLSTSESAEKPSARGSFTLKARSTISRLRSTIRKRMQIRQNAGNLGIKGGFILRGGKKTLRKKRRKKQKNKKVTRKRFI